VIGLSNMSGYLLYKFAQPEIEYKGVFWIMFAFSCIALVVGLIFKEEHDWKKK